jgi:hypothetical protein
MATIATGLKLEAMSADCLPVMERAKQLGIDGMQQFTGAPSLPLPLGKADGGSPEIARTIVGEIVS